MIYLIPILEHFLEHVIFASTQQLLCSFIAHNVAPPTKSDVCLIQIKGPNILEVNSKFISLNHMSQAEILL